MSVFQGAALFLKIARYTLANDHHKTGDGILRYSMIPGLTQKVKSETEKSDLRREKFMFA